MLKAARIRTEFVHDNLAPALRTGRHISVIGLPGSGKSTFAAKLGVLLRIPVIRMDDLAESYWQEHKKPLDEAEWRRKLHPELLQARQVITDGNYKYSLATRIATAGVIFFFDLPRIVCLGNAWRRACKNLRESTTLDNSGIRTLLSHIARFCSPRLYGRIIFWDCWNRSFVNNLLSECNTTKVIMHVRSGADIRVILSALDQEYGAADNIDSEH